MNSKDIPMFHKAEKTESGGYTYHCPICDTMLRGYPISGKRCENCGQIIIIEEEDCLEFLKRRRGEEIEDRN